MHDIAKLDNGVENQLLKLEAAVKISGLDYLVAINKDMVKQMGMPTVFSVFENRFSRLFR